MFARLTTMLGAFALMIGIPLTALGLGGPMSALDDYAGHDSGEQQMSQATRNLPQMYGLIRFDMATFGQPVADSNLVSAKDFSYGKGLMIGSEESESSKDESSEEEDSSA